MAQQTTARSEWIRQIRDEHARLEVAGELAGPAHPLLRHLLATWRRDSPKMWVSLQQDKLGRMLAQVLVARRYAREKALMETGMPITDAREQADREILMLEPETEPLEYPLMELENVLQESRQMLATRRVR